MNTPISKPPHDHARCIQEALSLAEKLCRERGVRLTPLRRRVLELIWEDHRAVKAYELLGRLEPLRSAKPATVYRALEFLLTQGLIHRLESQNAFIGCSCGGRPHQVLLLICNRCGKVTELPAPKVMTALASMLEQVDFLPQQQAIEVSGLCAECGTPASDTKD